MRCTVLNDKLAVGGGKEFLKKDSNGAAISQRKGNKRCFKVLIVVKKKSKLFP